MNINIIGYYGHYNIGDEQYKISFINLLNNLNIKYTINFIDCDKLLETNINNDDIIILGGGDVLNEYFMNKMIMKFENKPNKIIAVSVGLPYKDILINTSKLKILDYIFVRTKQDLDLFKTHFNNNITYIPDISYNLINNNNKYKKLINIKKNKKIVGFALSRHIYHKDYINEYNNCLNSLCKFIKTLISQNYHIVFIPFNTHHNSNSENDILIYNDIIDILDPTFITQNKKIIDNDSNITFIKKDLTFDEIFELFNLLDFCIPMRFHACLFSIYTNTPFLPIFTTRKIKNLLLDINWTYYYECHNNNIDIPIDIDYDALLKMFNNLKKSSFKNINLILKEDYDTGCKKILEIILKPKQQIILDTTNIILDTTNIICNKNINSKNIINHTFLFLQNYAYKNNFTDFRLITDNKLKNLVVKIVSYYLTSGNSNSNYNYGLSEKMFNIQYNYKEEWKWILENYKKNELKNNPNGLFNLCYIDQNDYSGSHRSGWQYVYENIKYLHNNEKIILDMSIDKTFHWDAELNKILNIIPYNKPWIGFVHHTFDTTFSDYNCKKLLESLEFIESLKYCKGIVVLSEHLKNEFIKHNINNIYVLNHPTDIIVPKFKFSKFIKNNDKKIFFVGGWLRNVYSYYNLDVPSEISYNCLFKKKKFKIRKVALKGKNMNNYYPQDNFLNDIYKLLSTTNSDNSILKNCSNGTTYINNTISNNWYKHFYEDITNKINSINIIEYMNNTSFDNTLTENIVFINLVDASAVNTIIECIVRNTPIIINKIPPVIELLGEDYPLYYTNINQVFNIIKNVNNIKKAYYYIKRLPKERYLINNFIKELSKICKNM